uniref:Putative ovule protein n=1 Tax=Solanum chacoense TaxID=4108 RepID=A0A0V0GKQ4_SOLCH
MAYKLVVPLFNHQYSDNMVDRYKIQYSWKNKVVLYHTTLSDLILLNNLLNAYYLLALLQSH